MTVGWRIVKRKHARSAFDGEGARRFGGRWNPRGARAFYLADSLALAALELYVHVGRAGASLQLVSFRVAFPDGVAVETLAPEELPANWRAEPPPEETKELGGRWLAGGRAVALRVPSVIVPREANFVVNPVHPDFARLAIDPPERFSFDPRMG